MSKNIDILGLGYTAVDDLLYLDNHPEPDSKMQVKCRERQCGGLTATALVAAARMGCHCAYAGILGDDEYSQFVIQRFREEGIDVTHVRRRADARPVRSTIIVDRRHHTRTILYDLNGVAGKTGQVRSSGMDHRFRDEPIRVQPMFRYMAAVS